MGTQNNIENEKINKSRRFLIGAILGTICIPPVVAAGAGIGPRSLYQRLRTLIPLKRFPFPSGKKKPDGIVIHHSATKPEQRDFESAKTIDIDHKARGLGVRYKGKVYNIAYHYVILPDGTIQEGRPVGCRGAHTRVWGYNYWVGICLVGYFDKKWSDKKYHRPTKKQMDALADLSLELMKKYKFKKDRILPHRDINPTECPGKSFPMKEYIRLFKTMSKKTGSV
jgi:N-acetylmuramoyl-L-alanine amidase